jgi:hypothetical protein
MAREGVPLDTILGAIPAEDRTAVRDFVAFNLAIVVLDTGGPETEGDELERFQQEQGEYARQLARVLLALTDDMRGLSVS